MKKLSLIIVGILFIPLILTSCNQPDTGYVRSAQWVWSSGYKIGDGDFVEFDSDFYKLSHDTIYRKGIPKCIVISTDKKRYEMVVRSFDGQTGYYADTEEFTK